MNIRQTGTGLALVAAGSLAVLWLTPLPLGVPEEWAWSRIPVFPGQWVLLVTGWLYAGVVGGLYVGLVTVAALRLARASGVEMAAWLSALALAGFGWLWALQESPAAPERALGKSAWVLYYHAHEGYFEQARYEMSDVPSYLAGYEDLMRKGDYLHLGTHPPGLMLFHRACLAVCAQSPGLCELLERTEPASFREVMDVTQWAERKGLRPLNRVDPSALWLAVLLTQAIAAATVVPLYLLARRTHSRTTSWWTAALWPLVPALAIFLPKSDALLPFVGALFLWLWLEGFRRGRLGLCAAAGAVFSLGMFLSLAVLPVALAAGLITLWEAVLCRREERTGARGVDWAARIGAAAVGWGLPVLCLRVAARINLLTVWRLNLRNHAAFYDHSVRTYWKWLLVNPVELTFAVGAPLIFACVIGWRRSAASGGRSRAMGPYWCLSATWLLLWLSGKNMGEAARLWLVFMPWAVWLAAGFFARQTPAAAGATAPFARGAVALLIAQLAVAIGTVTRVTGFDFPNLPEAQSVSMREELPQGAARSLAAAAIRPIGR